MPIEDIPHLSQPLDIGAYTPVQEEELAGKIQQAGSPFTKDQLIDQLALLQQLGKPLDQKSLDSLLAADAVLPEPGPVNFSLLAATSGASSTGKGNPWLSGNSLVAFVTAYFELIHVLSMMKLSEAEMTAKTIMMTWNLAEEMASLIKDIAEQEKGMHIAAAVSAGVSLLGTLAGAGAAYKLGRKRVGESVKPQETGQIGEIPGAEASVQKKAQKKYDGQTLMVIYQAISQGVGQISKMGEETAQAILTGKKGQSEAMKAVVEALQKLTERMQASAIDGFRSDDEMLQQFIQALTKLIDENIKAYWSS